MLNVVLQFKDRFSIPNIFAVGLGLRLLLNLFLALGLGLLLEILLGLQLMLNES